MYKKHVFLIAAIGCGISGCSRVSYDFYRYDSSYSDTEMLYERGYIVRDAGIQAGPPPLIKSKPVILSQDSMLVSTYAGEAKVAHPPSDNVWVKQQVLTAYTIELVDDVKPAVVSHVLLQTPKMEHSAAYRYVHNGVTRYKGLYGSFNTHQAAQEALQKLPAKFKANSRITQFGNL